MCNVQSGLKTLKRLYSYNSVFGLWQPVPRATGSNCTYRSGQPVNETEAVFLAACCVLCKETIKLHTYVTTVQPYAFIVISPFPLSLLPLCHSLPSIKPSLFPLFHPLLYPSSKSLEPPPQGDTPPLYLCPWCSALLPLRRSLRMW